MKPVSDGYAWSVQEKISYWLVDLTTRLGALSIVFPSLDAIFVGRIDKKHCERH